MIILFIIGFFSGIIAGLGIGGGAILIPALTLFLDMDQKTAQSINLIYFIPTALIASITHFKNKNIKKDSLIKLILFGFLGVFLGFFIINNISNDSLRKIFGVFLLIMGLMEIFRKGKDKNEYK